MKCKLLTTLSVATALFLSAGANASAAAQVILSPSDIIAEQSETISVKEQVKISQESSSPLSGSCGDDLTWNFDLDTGTLVISGSGAMEDFMIGYEPKVQFNTIPWNRFSSSITSVKLNGNITHIGELAFNGCQSLREISLPDSVTSIGYNAFSGCKALTGVQLPDGIVSIEHSTFSGCAALERITLPDTVTSVGSDAFSGCTALKTVTLSRSLQSIDSYAFSGCKALTGVVLPDSVTKTGYDVFSGCDSLSSVTLPHGLTSIGKLFAHCTGLKNIILPDGAAAIEGGAFTGCTGLTNIVIPDSVTEIKEASFSGCTGLTSVTIPDSVTSIGIEAFSGCTSLKEIALPRSLTTINDRTFEKCKSLTTVTLPDSVTTIGDAVFSDCTELTGVVIPDSVTSLGRSVFFHCSSLSTVALPSSVTSVKDVFSGCTGLKNITLPSSLTAIGESAFRDCTQLTDVTIPASVTSVENAAFQNCSSLTGIVLPDGVNFIRSYAFADCKGLTNLRLPDSVKYIDKYAFRNCTGLTRLVFPDSVRYIEEYAFSGCNKLSAILIPASVTTIKNNAFTECSQLIDLYYGGTASQWGALTQLYPYTGIGSAVTVYYGATEIPDRNFLSVSVQHMPEKTNYQLGEKFDSAGFVLRVNYSDGTSKTVTNGMYFNSYGAFSASGARIITVTYAGKKTAFTIFVHPYTTSVTIVKKPAKLTYFVGESFSSSGMKLKISSSDGTTKEITGGFTCTPSKLTVAGQQKIVVSYGGKSTGFYVTVNPAVSSVTIAKKPAKLTYFTEESFSSSGMKLKVTYPDGSVKEITSGFTYTPTKLNTAGQQKIVVSYGGRSTGFYVTVNKAVSSVTIAKKPTKLTYKVGESFNAAGMKLKVTYTDGTTKEVTSGFSYSPSKLNTAGQQKIVVSYGGKTTGFYVTVNKAVSSVTIVKKPTKLTYKKGETFNSAGMKLKVTYTDGTTKQVTSGFSYSPSKLNTAGQQKIVVNYGGKTTGFYVTVR